MQVSTGRKPRKLVITGATGFIGSMLVPRLAEAGHTLLLVGREKASVIERFPSIRACEYAELKELAAGYDAIIHLAVANNDADRSEQEFLEVNGRFIGEVAKAARAAGIPDFVNISSFHALDERNTSAYARSKRMGVETLRGVSGIRSHTIYLPAVYGDTYAGKLAVLNGLPGPIARIVFEIVSALKPVADISLLSGLVDRADWSDTQGDDLLLSDDKDKNFVYVLFRWSLDHGFALVAIMLMVLAYLPVSALVRLDSKGPVIFKQERVGRDGRIFRCLKFRTMREDTVQAATHQVSADNVTAVGRVLRKTKMDEFPQALNIIRQEMSLIGPRPCLPSQEELIEARQKKGVLRVKPGVTGLAQVLGVDMSDPEKLARIDARYIAMRSVLLDLKILLQTARGQGGGDRVR
ncbi:NAD-dependent epimerase/dehydratase family protein [Halovulum dunhuangense]|uniref:NAD-dependent epimerase/dehydratase family protein n=1 Tax=Halovulum dunhuangense TaxID=1505036 RepID=A0A849L3I2_9RHOB|nr:sugar transferase [Halovulum dunhuangense]NNU80879.1 NAD-dependent epimerase/dehydratase family protein [Halovulum dunhuangense]